MTSTDSLTDAAARAIQAVSLFGDLDDHVRAAQAAIAAIRAHDAAEGMVHDSTHL